jgi:hypothetical protein
MTEAHVEKPDHQLQIAVEFLHPQCGVNVADVVLAD